MASNTDAMLLDEPTEGLDPESSEEILSILTDFAAERERTLVLATHRLDEVERICDQISILHEGKLRLSGNLDDIKANWKTIELMEDVPVERALSGYLDGQTATGSGFLAGYDGNARRLVGF
jgi:ABC-2 type transport system ATP-binding protein